jgi:glyoxylase-like metal-dependent hydrolase (beta-lactamase superfamily II)/predicted ester cyclase
MSATEQTTEAKAAAAKPIDVARRYFAALSAHDLDEACACWANGGIERIVGVIDTTAPHGVRDYFGGLFAAFPDFKLEIADTVVQRDKVAVRWTGGGTFAGPGSFQGIEPTGGRLELEGFDLLTISDGRIQRNDAYTDGATIARQIGLLPPQGSSTEERMTKAFNAKTRFGLRLGGGKAEPVADGVWIVRGGFPIKTMNVYLIEEAGGGVVVFDAGIRDMTRNITLAAGRLGGVNRVVLGHAHADHRGAAPGLDAPVYCHPLDKADAEGDGGAHYFHLEELAGHGRFLLSRFLPHWDGGPVEIAGTVEEGDEIAGFKVIHLPGHAPGLIGLWRESDRLALVSDCFYTLDPQTGIKGKPRVPHRAFNSDTEQARASIRKLAALEPAAAWAGHADPLTGDVRTQLEQAANTT